MKAWPAEKIDWTLSNKSSGAPISETLSRNAIDLPTLAQAFPLPWSAYVRLLSVKNEHARAFYETETLRGGWSVRQLDRQVNSQFYERIALSHNKAAMLLTRHSREGGNPRIYSGERRSEGSETACRPYPRQSAQRHSVHWRDIGSDKTDMGTQERCSRGFHSKVWRSHAGPGFVTPAQAGVQKAATEPRTLDSRLRGNDGIFERLRSELEARRIACGGDAESGV